VATHVRAILSKTHTANRTEAAAYAMEHNLYKGSGPAAGA
jgi:DNA-binding NarL/FixJ family response regulator